LNNINEPSAGILDNDKNGDGIPDYILSVSSINLKPKLYQTIDALEHAIANNESPICFGISIIENEESSEYEIQMHFDDTVTRIGRT
jgi:hypothetical protein